MQTLILTTHFLDDIANVVVASTVEEAIEKLYAQMFDIVVLGNDVTERDEIKLRKILSLQPNELLVLRQKEESIKFTLAQSKFLWNNYLYGKGKISLNDFKKPNEKNFK